MYSSPRDRRGPPWAVLVLCGAACAGKADPLAANHACFRALDCQDGLVCVEGRCTDDIAPIVPEGAGTPVEPSGGAQTEADPEAQPDPEAADPEAADPEQPDPYDP